MEPLASSDDLQRYLQRDVDPATATLLLAGASAVVRSHCGWPVSEETETLTVIGTGSLVAPLPTLRLTAVEEVRAAGVVVAHAAAAETTWPAGVCVWTPSGLLIRPGGWADLVGVEADCTHGYDPVPDDVRLVTLAVAARFTSNPGNLAALTVGAVSRTYSPSNPPLAELEAALLDTYRLSA